MTDPWQDVPFPPPPRDDPPRRFNRPAFGCVVMALCLWWLVYAIILVGERMVDAVLSIQWPI